MKNHLIHKTKKSNKINHDLAIFRIVIKTFLTLMICKVHFKMTVKY